MAVSTTTTTTKNMDLLMITFNCAKTLIEVPIFAGHLRKVLERRGEESELLPDVVVFSLQEVAPLSPSFVGGYFLNPFFKRFEEAVNLAAAGSVSSSLSNDYGKNKNKKKEEDQWYTLIKADNVGCTALIVLARDASRVKDVQQGEIGFGAGGMGNKGAVGLRMMFTSSSTRGDEEEGIEEGEVTFIATHLAAMEWNLARRNSNWGSIVTGLTFSNPEDIITTHHHRGRSLLLSEQTLPLLNHDDEENNDAIQRKHLHNISIYKPSSHLFLAGDLNYRISSTSPTAGSSLPSLDPTSENYYPGFLVRDQLTRERLAGRTCHGLVEGDVTFPPTYKLVFDDDDDNKEEGEVKWSFAKHRYPSWTDRILYLDTPPSLPSLRIVAYDAMPAVRTSDHRPVFLRALVPLIGPAEMVSALENGGGDDDPRVRLPLEMDPEAWERRKAVRRREVVLGWTGVMVSSVEGMGVVMGVVVALGIGWWWLVRMQSV